MSDSGVQPCELCKQPGGALLWKGRDCRVVAVDDPHYPGFCRVICNDHVREMTDLDEVRRHRIMSVVFAVESVVRDLYSPDKVNLASFGNMVPHVHWHVIPRWCDDRHFPEPVWGSVHHETSPARPPVTREALAAALTLALKEMG
jgi:diadenosine tetraphosphate (Ap4A) HIT family hydrolase